MAATAAHRLMEANKISPKDVFRIDTRRKRPGRIQALVSDATGVLEQVYGEGSVSRVLGYEWKFACVSGRALLRGERLDSAALVGTAI
ncbi:MAG: hypothetical protein JRM79_03670 [Nitrososphaerota archaeon]|jgi:hypothetical protein|nr:hypothetical protein [Nitrososphaerota archaeon]MDG6913291.1 hypothetical protein [Nitrososphaerota archaeon]MDG6937374.1 hypothetical protein [Nitrososphaerota archaeon]MDG6952435.1 hypothetical protein [Nitrososphaerota archaeon]MDG6958732.1 hypothetical protein [Nitrososphaerota archaeon]